MKRNDNDVRRTRNHKSLFFLGLVYAMISMKVILAAILRKYRFETDLKLNELILRFELTLKLSNKHLVRMERRN